MKKRRQGLTWLLIGSLQFDSHPSKELRRHIMLNHILLFVAHVMSQMNPMHLFSTWEAKPGCTGRRGMRDTYWKHISEAKERLQAENPELSKTAVLEMARAECSTQSYLLVFRLKFPPQRV